MLTPKVQVEEVNGVRVVSARGEFVGGSETDKLQQALQEEMTRGTACG